MKETAPKRVVFYSTSPDGERVIRRGGSRLDRYIISSPFGSVLVKIFLAIIVVNLAILNFLLLRENFSFKKARDVATRSADMMVSETAVSYKEIEKLKQDLEAKIATAQAKPSYSYVSPIAGNYTPAKKAAPNFEHKMEYIKFPGARGTNATEWWDVPGMEVKFNIANFPNYTAWWEANLRVKDGGGKASARLFDTFANIPLPASEIETSTGNLITVSSDPLKFYPGDRTYRVQIKSLFGNEAVVEDAKIKISWIRE